MQSKILPKQATGYPAENAEKKYGFSAGYPGFFWLQEHEARSGTM